MSFIPGMSGVHGAGGGLSPLSTISVAGVNFSESSETIAYPPAVELREGDVALFFDFCTAENNGSAPTTVIPFGYTALQNSTGNTFEIDAPDVGRCRFILSYKILTGSEFGTLTGMIENRNEEKFLMIVRGNVPIAGVTVHDYSFLGANSNPPETTITSGSGQVPLLAFAQVLKTGNPPAFTAQSPAFANMFNTPTRFIVGYTVYNTNPVNHTVDSDASGIGGAGPNNWAARVEGYFQFTGAE